MKEFMLYIRNAGDSKAILTAEQHFEFIKKYEVYINKLKSENKLIAAQPIVREGFLISKTNQGWSTAAIDPTKETQVGYYHILAQDIDEAMAIAKYNPEFEYVPSATIEVRPIKVKEEKTNFVYPNSSKQ
ncbi:MAG: hypothetical protein V4497_08790 [Bacteroidota bacterium]